MVCQKAPTTDERSFTSPSFSEWWGFFGSSHVDFLLKNTLSKIDPSQHWLSGEDKWSEPHRQIYMRRVNTLEIKIAILYSAHTSMAVSPMEFSGSYFWVDLRGVVVYGTYLRVYVAGTEIHDYVGSKFYTGGVCSFLPHFILVLWLNVNPIQAAFANPSPFLPLFTI